ncbi:cysteine peptidase family C39 domain-containing protein [Pararhizobium sp.]|uniref:cysteine peptidase family C39 domain-containing protein n=1 Tax=Pararhizobium sp. TaxID=1977563 RepID=UPI003D1433F6
MTLKAPAVSRRRTPTLLQVEAAECGAVALGIMLAFYGRWLTIEELRTACNVSRDGSSAKTILRAAQHQGLDVQAMKMEPAHLRKAALPAIIHWGMNHFLVVEGFSRGKVHLNDPALGPRTVSDEEFDRNFTGIVLTMKPGGSFVRAGSKPSLARALTERLKGSGDAFSFIVIISLILVVPGLLVPVFSQVFIDQILVNRFDNWMVPLLAGMVACAVLMGVLTWLQRETLLRLETRLALAGALQFAGHVVRLPIGYFAQRHPGEVAGRVMLNDRVAQLMASEVGFVAFNLLTALAYLAAMLLYAPVLAIIVAAFAAANFLLLLTVSRSLEDENRRLLMATNMQAGFAKQGLQMVESYKAGGTEDLFRQRLSAMNIRMLNLRQTVARVQMRLNAMPGLSSIVLGGVVLVIGGNMVIEGKMTLGMLVAFQALMAGFLAPMSQLIQLGGRIQDGQAYLRVLDDTLQHPLAAEFLPGNGAAPASARLNGAIELDAVSFAFSAGAAPLLKGISLRIEPGERLGIVGASGSGKSTLGALIAGLFEPTGGNVLIDGISLHNVGRERLRQSMAFVDQRSAIFEATMRENISLFDHSLPDERIVAATRMALIHDVILRRPSGYGAMLREGGTDLAGGQRSRIEIARALVREPRILIMDEATAALDNQTEAALFANLRRLGATQIVIAHRYSAIRECDRVIVLEKGEIVQSGAPAVLYEQPGPFRTLMREEA